MSKLSNTLRHCVSFIGHYGLRKSLSEAGPFVRELISRSEERGERAEAFDAQYATDTAGAVMPWELRSIRSDRSDGTTYETQAPRIIREMLGSIPELVDGFVFVDLGSGKGRALLLASELPFAKIVGVEHSRELYEIAQRNLALYQSPSQKCRAIELILAKAEEYTFEPEPLVIFMYNPFGPKTMASVVENLRHSVYARPRKIFIIYANPRCETIFEHSRHFETIKRTATYNVYEMVARGKRVVYRSITASAARAPNPRDSNALSSSL